MAGNKKTDTKNQTQEHNSHIPQPEFDNELHDDTRHTTPQHTPPSEPNTNAQLEIIISSLEKEVEDWKQKALRLAADIQNSQRQHELDTAQNSKITKKRVMQTLMQFLNTLSISFNFIPETINDEGKQFIQTLKASFQSVYSDLEHINIKLIMPHAEEAFNPAYMSALNESEVSQQYGDVFVQHTVGIGLVIDNQVIQPASVIVKKIDNA